MYLDFLQKAIKSRPSKFKGLFFSMLTLFILQPLIPETSLREAIVTLTISIVLITSVYAVSDEKQKYIVTSVVLAVPALIITTLHYLSNDTNLLTISYISKIVFFTYITYVSLHHVLKAEQVSDDTIYGSICVYLLLGLCWAHIYALVEQLSPGSFRGLAQDYSHPEFATNALRDFIYHSYVTLTTLGNGDITPVSMMARTLAILEAIMGQVYLTVLVARIIGLYIKSR